MLTDEQNNAMITLKNRIKNKEPISILQGYAGTGKSFTLSYLIQELGYSNHSVAFCAFTGAAAKILMDNGLNASTIHRLIYKPIFRNNICIGFRKKHRSELYSLRLIVVDEYSMVSQSILDDLQSFGVPLLLVGDSFQLPPIGKPNQYYNEYNAFLHTVQRQALNSPLLWAATKIREGEILKEGNYDNKLLVGRKHQLDENWLRSDVQFICGTNATRHNLNTKISGSASPQKGDKIIFLRNHFDQGIVNGSITVIDEIYTYYSRYYLDFFYEGIPYKDYISYYQNIPKKTKYFINTFDKGYAITCHKAQGATIFDPMCIIDESYYFKPNSSKWLYTALTRGTGKKPVALLR